MKIALMIAAAICCLCPFDSGGSGPVAGPTVRFLNAVPVWPKGMATEMNVMYGFRAKFNVEEKTHAFLRVTGCSAYRVMLNGRHVGWGPVRAAKGYFRVDEIPLPVKRGVNWLSIEVAGYHCKSYYHMEQPSFLQAEVVSDGKAVVCTGVDGGFEAMRLPRLQRTVRYSYQRTFSEAYRLSAGCDDWKTGRGRFTPVVLEERPAVKLIRRKAPFPDYAVNTSFKPLSTAKINVDKGRATRPIRFVNNACRPEVSSAFTIDNLEINWWKLVQQISSGSRAPAGEAMKTAKRFRLGPTDSVLFGSSLDDSGFIGLKVKCLEPGTLAVKFDEILVDGEISPTRNATVNVVAWEFTEPGTYEIESFEPYTLMYADVMAMDGRFEISAPYVRTFKNPRAGLAKLESSDKALEKIFAAARESFAQNAAGLFTDCPSRERASWLCDSFFIARASMLFTGTSEAERLFLENFVLAEKFENLPEGMPAMCYPADFPTGRFIPNWAMWLVLQVEEYMNRGGDPELVEAFRPRLVKLIEYFRTFRNSDGLLEKLPKWVFVEWSMSNKLVQDVSYPSNMTWAEVLDAMDRMYGMPEMAKEAQKVRETVRKQSWTGKWFCDNAVRQKDGTLKLSGECTETCQYYAFYFKTATPQMYPELWKTLVEDFGPKRKATGKYPEIWPSNAFVGNYLRLELLSRAGLSGQILDETRNFFLYMAELTGTLWEHTDTSASCCHGFASHAAVVYRRDILGVRNIDHVARTVEFVPSADIGLESVSMDIPVKGGVIHAGWVKDKDGLKTVLELPKGWSASGLRPR